MNSNSMQFFFKKKFTYSCVSWRPLVAFLMEFKLHELEFHANFLFLFIFIYLFIIIIYIFLKFDRSILNFLQIEFYIETRF